MGISVSNLECSVKQKLWDVGKQRQQKWDHAGGSIPTKDFHFYSRSKKKLLKDIKQEGELYGMVTLVLCNDGMAGIGEREEQVLLKELAEGRVAWVLGGCAPVQSHSRDKD